jgi:hypothetical protein
VVMVLAGLLALVVAELEVAGAEVEVVQLRP